MKRSQNRLWLFGTISIAWISMTGIGHAWDVPEINARFEFHVEYKRGLRQARPTAPWYAYFPVDPRMQPAPQTTPFPSWPAPIAPPFAPAVLPNMKAQMPAANDPRISQTSHLWQNQGGYGLSIQPVGYYSAQTPSYWYRNP